MARLTQGTARRAVDQFFDGHDSEMHYEVIVSDTGASVTAQPGGTGSGRGAWMNSALAHATVTEMMDNADEDVWGVSIDALSLSIGSISSPGARRVLYGD